MITELFAQPGSKPTPSSFIQWRWLLVLQLHSEEANRCWKRQDPVGGGWQQAETLPVMTHHRQPRNTWRPSPGFLKKKKKKHFPILAWKNYDKSTTAGTTIKMNCNKKAEIQVLKSHTELETPSLTCNSLVHKF